MTVKKIVFTIKIYVNAISTGPLSSNVSFAIGGRNGRSIFRSSERPGRSTFRSNSGKPSRICSETIPIVERVEPQSYDNIDSLLLVDHTTKASSVFTGFTSCKDDRIWPGGIELKLLNSGSF